MAARDVELVRGLYEAWLAGDEETALAVVDPNIEWIEPPDAPESDTHHGPEGIAFSTERWTAPFEDWRMEVDSIRELREGKVLVAARQYGRGRGSSVDVEAWVFHLWTLLDGRATRVQMFMTEPEAIAAADSSRPEDRA
jgi:ketosteroid isomerase-like protein